MIHSRWEQIRRMVALAVAAYRADIAKNNTNVVDDAKRFDRYIENGS